MRVFGIYNFMYQKAVYNLDLVSSSNKFFKIYFKILVIESNVTIVL